MTTNQRAQYRYLKLSEPTSGVWPEEQTIQPGVIIRIPFAHPVPSGPAVFNEATKGWATASWVEVANPATNPTQQARLA